MNYVDGDLKTRRTYEEVGTLKRARNEDYKNFAFWTGLTCLAEGAIVVGASKTFNYIESIARDAEWDVSFRNVALFGSLFFVPASLIALKYFSYIIKRGDVMKKRELKIGLLERELEATND